MTYWALQGLRSQSLHLRAQLCIMVDILQFISGQCQYSVLTAPAHLTPPSALKDLGKEVSPRWAPATVVQCVAAVLAGCTTSLLTNPLDLVRTRVQVTLSSALPRPDISPALRSTDSASQTL